MLVMNSNSLHVMFVGEVKHNRRVQRSVVVIASRCIDINSSAIGSHTIACREDGGEKILLDPIPIHYSSHINFSIPIIKVLREDNLESQNIPISNS